MAKTELTLNLENQLWQTTSKMGVFGCFEVTIGYWGNERVDYMTYDTKGIWRCYEIKVSKADFFSKAKKTFIGNFNYYVMPKELYLEVKEEIPANIGVHNGYYCMKKAKRQELAVDEEILKNSMIRSLSRENEKFIKTNNNKYMDRLRNEVDRYKKQSIDNHNKYCDISNAIYMICDKYNLNCEEVRKLIRDKSSK